MTYEVEAGGQRRTIEVHRAGREWQVTLDGRTMPVSVTAVEGRWSLLIGPPEGGPDARGAGAADPGVDAVESDVGAAFRRPMRPMKSYEVALDGRGNGGRIVHTNGIAVPVSIVDPRARLTAPRKAVATAGPGPRAIVAPMAGRIVKVLVAAGDVVAAHQGLVVVEAMKMENELRSPKAGTVTEVRVTEGRSVDANAVLIVME